jgi:spectinomycin phosphotransferase
VSADKPYFLKVRKGQLNEPSLSIPRYLSDHGIEQVIAPLHNQSGHLWTELESFKLILYPFIEGETGGKKGMSDAQLIELGQTLRKMHSLALSDELLSHLRKETFVPKWVSVVQSLLSNFPPHPIQNDCEQAFADLWNKRRDDIQKVLTRALILGSFLQKQPLEHVLCHADIHKWNVLVDPAGRLFIVDWDETVYAPKERDLMHIGGSNTHTVEREREVDLFYQGYGKTEINPTAMAFYRYAWAVEEIGSFSERALLTPGVGEATQQQALRFFRIVLQPNEIVDMAFALDKTLPSEVQALLT